MKGTLDTIENLCSIVRLLLDSDNNKLIPTCLELMLQEIQELVDNHCVVKNGDS